MNDDFKWLDEEQVFWEYNGEVGCSEEKALSILLAHNVLFANSRKYFELDDMTPQEETIVLFVICNDLFWWGTADAESLTLDEVPELYKKWKADKKWGSDKWCCKKRGMQPQKPVKEDMIKDSAWESWMDELKDPGPS